MSWAHAQSRFCYHTEGPPQDQTPLRFFGWTTFSARLLRLTPKGELITAAGGGEFVKIGTEPGSASQVALYMPQGIFVGKNDEVFFSDDDNRIIRHLDQADGTVTNFATTPKQFHSTGGFPVALVGNEEYFYLSDPSGNCIWRISRNTGKAELYAGQAPRQNGPSNSSRTEGLRSPSNPSPSRHHENGQKLDRLCRPTAK